MDLQPSNRVSRRLGARSARKNEAARRLANARGLCLAALCIAVFECSQLVFHSANRPDWADESAQIASTGADNLLSGMGRV